MSYPLSELTAFALDALPQAVLVVEGGGRIIIRNTAARELLAEGEGVGEVLDGRGWEIIDWPGEVASLAESPEGISKRNVPITGRGGRQIVADVFLRWLRPAGQASQSCAGEAVIVVVEDVSWRVSIQRRLTASERLAATGAVAGRVAHELNNPLDGILRYIGLAERTAGQHAAKYLAKAREGLMRMAAIIRELISAGGKTAPQAESAAISKLLVEAVSVMQPRADASGIAIACDLAHCDDVIVSGNIFQVFCNVIKNALDAMEGGGLLTIRMRRGPGNCRIEFEDTGCGISPEQAKDMFEPFYTTKPAGKGMGLGLAICREIINAAGGEIQASPRTSGGTKITVTLPAIEPARSAR